MAVAEGAGQTGDALQAVEDAWMAAANIKLFDDAVIDVINSGSYANKKGLIVEYRKASKGKSNAEARSIAKGLTGKDIYFDWGAARTREGYYRYQGGTQCAINRAVAYAPYADLLWMESKKPDYDQAEEFAKGVQAIWPHKKLAYNLSPSFNWGAAMPRDQQETYIKRLGELGYCWQFITLAGLHTTALISDTFAKAYAKRGMAAYGELVQELEIKNGNTPEVEYVNSMLKMVTGGVSSTAAMGKEGDD